MYSRSSSRRRRSLLIPRTAADSPGMESDGDHDNDLVDEFEEDSHPTERSAVTSNNVDRTDSDVAPKEPVVSQTREISASKPLAAPNREENLPSFPAIVPEVLLPRVTSEPTDLVVNGPGLSPDTHFRVEATALFGRGSQCDVMLPHADVSRRHMLLQRVADRLLFVDLCSRTGVICRGKRRVMGWLEPGDELRLGPYIVRRAGKLCNRTAAIETPPERLFSRQSIQLSMAAGLGVRITGSHGGRAVDVPLDRPITIVGRDSQCKLRLRDASVSRMHVGILLSNEAVFAVDLQRRDGMTVNGRAVRQTELRVGDELQIGKYRIQLIGGIHRCEPGTAIAAPPLSTGLIAEPPSSVLATNNQIVTAHESEAMPAWIGLALVGALADLQHQFHEQSRQQMEMMFRIVETMQADLRDKLLAEMQEIRQITTELQATQQAMIKMPLAGNAGAQNDPVPVDSHAKPSSETPPLLAAPVEQPAFPETTAVRRPAPAGNGSQADDPICIAQRIAELQRERTNRWERLLHLVGKSS